MLRNYLLIAYRNLWHNKVYALINVLGLAIGLTAALFIFQYVQFEKSYDSFHENADNIYRLISQITINGVQESPQHKYISNFSPIVKNECPEVLEYARLFQHWTDNFIFSYEDPDGTSTKEFREQKVYYADASFMKMFSFPMIMGDPIKGLEEPNSLLMSERMAQKFFGPDWQAAHPLGKTLTLNGNESFEIKGVFKDIPENSHIKLNVLLSLTTLAQSMHYDTENLFHFRTYLQINPQADAKKLEAKLMQLQDKYYGEGFKQLKIDAVISIQPLSDTHLHSFGYKVEPEIRGSATTVQFLFITGFFILILAWINYVNLSTARAVKRAKEVGIRKVVGASRKQLIIQFLLEAVLITLLSLLVAGTLYQLSYSTFTGLVQREIPITFLIDTPGLLTGVGLLLIAGTLLSGGYAALVLSSFKTVSIMKGKFYASVRGILLRKGLIVFQFVISVGLIVATIGVFEQLHFMKDYEKGIDISQKLILRTPKIITNERQEFQYESFKTDLLKLPNIDRVSASYVSPGDHHGKGDQFVQSRKTPDEIQVFTVNFIDYDYFDSYDVQLLHGRGFSQEFPSDKHAAVITEDVALELGFDSAEAALQEKLLISQYWKLEVSIIGIVKNINLRSLKLEQNGVIFLLVGENKPDYFTVQLSNNADLSEQLVQIEELYKSHFPGNPFEYFFLDEYFNAQYQAEEQFGKVFSIASGLAIFIACLGLFGLSAFMIKQRTKEIGIRKVLGAPIHTILLLLSRDYIKLITIAGLIALPLAYWGLHRWLEGYMYRIQLSWWLFLIPVGMVIFIALVTVSVQTIKAALANPAKVLYNE